MELFAGFSFWVLKYFLQLLKTQMIILQLGKYSINPFIPKYVSQVNSHRSCYIACPKKKLFLYPWAAHSIHSLFLTCSSTLDLSSLSEVTISEKGKAKYSYMFWNFILTLQKSTKSYKKTCQISEKSRSSTSRVQFLHSTRLCTVENRNSCFVKNEVFLKY